MQGPNGCKGHCATIDGFTTTLCCNIGLRFVVVLTLVLGFWLGGVPTSVLVQCRRWCRTITIHDPISINDPRVYVVLRTAGHSRPPPHPLSRPCLTIAVPVTSLHFTCTGTILQFTIVGTPNHISTLKRATPGYPTAPTASTASRSSALTGKPFTPSSLRFATMSARK